METKKNIMVNFETQSELIQKFIAKKNISDSTAKLYCAAINDYERFNNMSISDLIEEADMEEENGIRMKNRALKDRLENYLLYNVNSNRLSNKSSLKYFQLVSTFYRFFEIEMPNISKIEIKNDYHMRYDDIPKKHHIKEALTCCKNWKEKAIIRFISSSGTAKNETLNLTIKDFVNATKEYHKNKGDLIDMIYDLEDYKDEIIPLFSLVRLKTDYPYYTCCSPETSKDIVKLLISRMSSENINFSDSLFDFTIGKFNYLFRRINAECGWGKVGYFNFFRSHMLRKYHATEIGDKSIVDTLHGRKRDSITESYFKHNPTRIKEDYLKVMDRVRV